MIPYSFDQILLFSYTIVSLAINGFDLIWFDLIPPKAHSNNSCWMPGVTVLSLVISRTVVGTVFCVIIWRGHVDLIASGVQLFMSTMLYHTLPFLQRSLNNLWCRGGGGRGAFPSLFTKLTIHTYLPILKLKNHYTCLIYTYISVAL